MNTPEPQKILVTGGTGFIGSHLVERLLEQGHAVRCLLRDPDRPRWLAGLPVELTRGDCTDPASLDAAVRGVDMVFHLAGSTRARRRREYFRQNQHGTENLLRACTANDTPPRRFVFLSSQAAAGPDPGHRPLGEDDPPAPLTAYGLSKIAAEHAVLGYAQRLPAVVLRPSTVYGPRDRDFLGYLRWVRRGVLARIGRGPRRVSMCHVDDLVDGILAAASRPVPTGSVYFLADPEPYPWNEVEAACQAALGVSARPVRFADWVVRGMAATADLGRRLGGRENILTRARLPELLEGRWACDSSRARTELGFAPRLGLRDGIARTVVWYEKQGWLQDTGRGRHRRPGGPDPHGT